MNVEVGKRYITRCGIVTPRIKPGVFTTPITVGVTFRNMHCAWDPQSGRVALVGFLGQKDHDYAFRRRAEESDDLDIEHPTLSLRQQSDVVVFERLLLGMLLRHFEHYIERTLQHTLRRDAEIANA